MCMSTMLFPDAQGSGCEGGWGLSLSVLLPRGGGGVGGCAVIQSEGDSKS